jgi:CheY-like chemotaxis protein
MTVASDSDHLESLTILCVEDNKTTQLLYQVLLEDVVKEIICADDGKKGYAKFLECDVDIIISDYEMPVMNGLEMIEKIRKKDKDIPIVLISAIDDVDVMITALKHRVNNFVRKPLVNEEIVQSICDASKVIIANNYLKEQREKKLNELEKQNSYNTYQEDLAFAKELNILRNDFYYQMIGEENPSMVDFLYHPLDVVSGDAYSVRRIQHHKTFYLIVDGMGKGLSASLTTMIITSFINFMIDKMLENQTFSLKKVVDESIEYIKPVLLDEEALAIDYILLDDDAATMEYAKFAMPAFLLQDKENNIIKIKSNNPPLSKWQMGSNVDTYSIKHIDKFLFFSDGIVENITKEEGHTYAEFIEEDFKTSFTREELKSKIFEATGEQEDDFTMAFINKLDFKDTSVETKSFETSLESIDAANEWYSDLFDTFGADMKSAYGANLVFTELFMNAYEHGNLGLDSHTKHKMLEDDTYFDSLLELEATCDKKINVKVSRVENLPSTYIVTQITDEGAGFDTQILSEIFRNSQTFNGRGVFVSRKNSMGIYYNAKGNSVLYLNKI